MEQLVEWMKAPWPWYVAGPLIGLIVPVLLLAGNKSFGVSSSLRHICAACVPFNIPFFKYNWRKEMWNLFFAGGLLIGGFIALTFLANPEAVVISEATQQDLTALGVKDLGTLLPKDIFSWSELFTLKGHIFFVIGGFMVGFGTRYAGGCTSGHAIMGISNLQLPSLIATMAFMAGGFFMTHLLLPYILVLVN